MKKTIQKVSIGDEDAMPDAILLSPTPQPQYEEEEQTI